MVPAKFKPLVAMFGALLYAVVGLRIFEASFISTILSVREATRLSGSEGLGAVSGVSDVFAIYVLLALASVVANRMLSSWARGSERAVTRLYRAQFFAIVLAFVVMIATPAVVALRTDLAEPMIPLIGVMWGATFVLTAVLLGWYALRSSL